MKLKTCLLSAIAALCVTFSAQAQISTGVSIGILQSHLRSDLFQQHRAGLGYRVGFDLSVPFGSRLEIMPSVAYATKGASIEATHYRPETGLNVVSYDFEYQVFQSQMMLGVKPAPGLRIAAGVYLDAMSNRLPTDENFTYLGDLTRSYTGVPVSTLNESFSGLDFGPAFGISYGKNRLRVNFQYMHGTKNLYTYSGPNAAGHSLKTRNLSVGATYLFLQ